MAIDDPRAAIVVRRVCRHVSADVAGHEFAIMRRLDEAEYQARREAFYYVPPQPNSFMQGAQAFGRRFGKLLMAIGLANLIVGLWMITIAGLPHGESSTASTDPLTPRAAAIACAGRLDTARPPLWHNGGLLFHLPCRE